MKDGGRKGIDPSQEKLPSKIPALLGLRNKKLLPKVYCFKMLITQNIVFRMKKNRFIYETTRVTSWKSFLSHNSEYGVC